jgi:hypothetical protein
VTKNTGVTKEGFKALQRQVKELQEELMLDKHMNMKMRLKINSHSKKKNMMEWILEKLD